VIVELPLLQSLAPDAVATAIKVEDLHLGLFAVDEDEEVAGERILFELLLDQDREAVIGFAHIGGLGMEPDAEIGLWE